MVSRCALVVTTQGKHTKSLRRGYERHVTCTLKVTTQRKRPKSLRRGSRSCDNDGDDNCEALCVGTSAKQLVNGVGDFVVGVAAAEGEAEKLQAALRVILQRTELVLQQFVQSG